MAVIGWDNPSSYRLPGAANAVANCWSQIQKKELTEGADWNQDRVEYRAESHYDGYFQKKWSSHGKCIFKCINWI
jgi:hypothetical protein